MKICFFGTRMDLISGHSRPAFELASSLIARGHEVRIISTTLSAERLARHESMLARFPKLARIPVERPFVSLQGMISQRRRTKSVLEAVLADCDLVHGFSFNATSVLLTLSPIRIPRILSVNTDIHPPRWDYLRVLASAPFYLQQARFIAGMLVPGAFIKNRLARFDRIICWSAYMRDRLRGLGVPDGRLSTIPIGINRSRFDLEARQEVRGSPVFLYAGLLSSLRGVPTLIRAFGDVIRSAPDARLIIADRGPHTPGDVPVHTWEQRHISRLIVETHLAGSIVIRPFQESLSGWFNACDAVVLPFSTTIGYAQPSLTLVEAMGHAKPVISTSVGSVPEYIEDGVSGILAHPGDAAGLARAMARFDPEAGREMGKTARRRIESLPGWDDIAAMTEAVYADAVHSNEKPSRPL
jgi:glycosyltransferase involved in cell wall biosynthesis